MFALSAWILIVALRFLPSAFDKGVWRLALADMRRRKLAAVTQIVALAMGLMALLLLTVVRGDLLDAWKDSTPPDAPNQAIFSIEAARVDALAARLRQFGDPVMYPRMLARIVTVNGQELSAAEYKDGLGKRLVKDEIEVSSAKKLPSSNSIVAGKWFADDEPGISVASNVAETLKLKVGDRMELDFAGTRVELPVISLRKINPGPPVATYWFMISQGAAHGKAATYQTAFHVPAGDSQSMNRLAQDFPNLIIVNFGAIVALLQSVLDQVSAAVEFLFLFTLASGLLVLYATLLASQNERMRQSAVLRALGASRRQLSTAQHLEYALIGALAGLLAAGGASAAGWALSRFVFKLEWSFSPTLMLAGLLAGAACSLVGGWAGLRAVLNHPPLQSLRTN